MGDAGEGLIDADERIQERMEERERERAKTPGRPARDPERARARESLRLARKELADQRGLTAHERRRAQLGEAIEEVDRRIAAMDALADS